MIPEEDFEYILARYAELSDDRDFRIDDSDERTVIERTDAEQEAFRAKLQEWRRTGSIPRYNGPKAAQ